MGETANKPAFPIHTLVARSDNWTGIAMSKEGFV